MSRTTPESVFVLAQEAMEHGDWETFFECLDHSDLMRLAAMAFGLTGGADLCLEHGIPADALARIETLAQDIQASAHAISLGQAGIPSSSPAQSEMLERSLRHRALVNTWHNAIEACLK